MKKPEIIIVDDHLIFRQGLRSLITSTGIAEVIAEASNGLEFMALLDEHKPALVLMDIDMPYMDGITATAQALAKFPDLKVIAFTMFGDEEYYSRMVESGVRGFILKSSGINELEQAIATVISGETYFSNEVLRRIISNYGKKKNGNDSLNISITEREREVLKHICLGLNNEEISEKLFISPKTIKTHRANLLEKTGCKNSPALIFFALKNKLVEI